MGTLPLLEPRPERPFWLEVLSQAFDDRIWSREPISMLALAARRETQIAQHLLRYGIEPDTSLPRRFDSRPIQYEAAATGQDELVEVLLAHGAGVKVTDRSGWTLLHAACYFGRLSPEHSSKLAATSMRKRHNGICMTQGNRTDNTKLSLSTLQQWPVEPRL
ncbi:hypothetical protein BDW66DRAFT_135577 [Aspergillus desertorum]